jgi:uncharacterized protein DUF3553
MAFEKGQRVRHPGRPEWGLGEVREDAAEGRVRVFFVIGGERTISLAHASLIPVNGADAAHPLLDNPAYRAPTRDDYQSLQTSITHFVRRYPGGFYGARFMEEEREYKMTAHKLCAELLAKQRFGRMLASHAYSDATRDALRVVNATNLIFPNEKMSLRDGLKTSQQEQQFCDALFSLLHDTGPREEGRFMDFAHILGALQAAKWTIATYFQFINDPETFMFLKPIATQRAARMCGFDIHYRADLNWRTYDSVQVFARYLRDELKELEPRDMIDVQSFMWTVRRGG